MGSTWKWLAKASNYKARLWSRNGSAGTMMRSPNPAGEPHRSRPINRVEGRREVWWGTIAGAELSVQGEQEDDK